MRHPVTVDRPNHNSHHEGEPLTPAEALALLDVLLDRVLEECISADLD
jgi:hypothetical protein